MVAKQPWNGTEEAASGQWELVGKGAGQLQTLCRRTGVASKIDQNEESGMGKYYGSGLNLVCL